MAEIPVVIICGGQGTRMRGSTTTKKELVEIGGRPIIWHVMRIFSAHGFNEFVLTLGYGANQLRRYFLEYEMMSRNLTLHIGLPENGRSARTYQNYLGHSPWQVALVDTGLHTEKAQRITKVADYLQADRFFAAYGDDVSDVDLTKLAAFHQQHGKLATITAVQIDLQYGIVEANDDGLVAGFVERPRLPYWINGGFMLFERQVLDIILKHGFTNLETEVLPHLAAQDQLMIYRHDGFWQSMNTMKDTILLEKIWQTNPPWKVWED
ncbi:MAG: NTP transferase domain-containing protein [Anaerolineales bacterium]|nr:NTP transferase domain-containing protein [Anaerolineales bacterium]MCA9928187.1 NTP transferase domain-containing protein [Anaerolineales bacterium]